MMLPFAADPGGDCRSAAFTPGVALVGEQLAQALRGRRFEPGDFGLLFAPAPSWRCRPLAGGISLAAGKWRAELGSAGTVLSNAILNEYLPFIILLFSLYTITGGIRIEGDLPAHPLTNTLFLAAGAVLANLIGTTGASMLLIRPLLATNAERKHVKHTVVLFIFIICNCGGCLLPLGPPLFLGYRVRRPVQWTLKLWPAWLR